MKFLKSVFAPKTGRAIAPAIAMVLGLASGVGLGEAIAPQPVHAQANRVNLSLQRQPNESFETFISRAEAAARATAQQNFSSSNASNSVAVTVLGESAGLVAPLLSLEVSRDSWRSRPDPQQWATYYSDARTLLGFESLAPATAQQPSSAAPELPTATTAEPPTPTATEPTAQPPATTIVPAPVPVSPAQPAPSATSIDTTPTDAAPGEPQQTPNTTGTQPVIDPPAQQPTLGTPNVGDTPDSAPETQNEAQPSTPGDPDLADQSTPNEVPQTEPQTESQTEVDSPGSIPAPGSIPVPEVYNPGPIGVPRSGVNN